MRQRGPDLGGEEGIASVLDAGHPERAHAQAEKLLADAGALQAVERDAASVCHGIRESGLLELVATALRG